MCLCCVGVFPVCFSLCFDLHVFEYAYACSHFCHIDFNVRFYLFCITAQIDVIAPKRETAQREMERRIVAQLLSCMDELTLENCGGRPVLVIGASNRPDSLDPALRRAGRFDREVAMSVPDAAARQSTNILRWCDVNSVGVDARIISSFDLGMASLFGHETV